jgi:hypothetical protein
MKWVTVVVAAMLLSLTADAQAQAPGQAQSSKLVMPCTIESLDSTVYKSGTTYRDCDVDVPAKLITAPKPKVALQHDPACVFVELEFAVDEEGHPVKATARALKGNSRNFTRLTLATLADWIYAPAMKDGMAVRQAVRSRVARENERLLTVTLLRPGERMPPPGPPDRPCK